MNTMVAIRAKMARIMKASPVIEMFRLVRCDMLLVCWWCEGEMVIGFGDCGCECGLTLRFRRWFKIPGGV
jgi:hypothetical protein